MNKKKPALTESEWMEVFRIRRRSKQGERLIPAESVLCMKAWKSNPMRYRAMDREVFNTTVPFGSTVRR